MPAPIVLRNMRDSYVDEARPKRNFNNLNRLKLSAASGSQKWAMLYFGRPYPAQATITSALLRVRTEGVVSGSVTLSASRIGSAWPASRVNWENKPPKGAVQASQTKSNAPSGTVWELDLTSLLQAVSNGLPWYGIYLEMTGAAVKKMFSANADQDFARPQLIIQWSDAPQAPQNMVPSGGAAVTSDKPVLQFDFVDVSGDTELAAVQVQIDPAGNFTSPAFDSNWINTDVPQVDLATTSYAGLANGATTQWRARVRDGAGIASAWSEPEPFTRVTRGTLALNSPGLSPNNLVNDSSPPIFWALTGATQAAYQVLIEENGEFLWQTGKISGAVNSIDTPLNLLKRPGSTYTLQLRVWDTVARAQTVNDPIFYQIRRDFTYQPGAITAPTLTEVKQEYPWPWVGVSFTRTSAPDSFSVYRDNELVENNIDPGDIFVSGTTYKYLDRQSSPRVPHTWQVVANVNRVDSPRSNPIEKTLNPGKSWMMELDTSNPIVLLKSASEPSPVVDALQNSMQETFQPLGGSNPVLITQFLRGFEGHVDAVLADDIIPGVSARQMRNRFRAWKKEPGKRLLLYMVDEVLTIVPYNMTYRPRAKGGDQVIYDISFDFFEVN